MKKVLVILSIIFVFLTGCESSLKKPSAINPDNIIADEIQFVTPSPKIDTEPTFSQTTALTDELQENFVNSELNKTESLSSDEEDKIKSNELVELNDVLSPGYAEQDINDNSDIVDGEIEINQLPESALVSSPVTESAPVYNSPHTESGALSNKKIGWYFMRGTDGGSPTAPKDFDISQFGGYYLGDTSKKNIYLTFDEGYENGYTEKILDVLKEKNVPAAFFVTKTYIRDNIEIVKRMAEEGHLVCNHSVKHKSFPDLSDAEIVEELKSCEDYYKEITGLEMPKYFRPPMGEYSARVLDIANKQGYKTIFWSFAHVDWKVDEQPSVETAYQKFIKDLHNGSIPLLHAVSSANTAALPRMIDSAREQGYEFVSLTELQ